MTATSGGSQFPGVLRLDGALRLLSLDDLPPNERDRSHRLIQTVDGFEEISEMKYFEIASGDAVVA